MADDYVAGLRCRMSETDVRAHSEGYRQIEIYEPEDAEFLVARKGNTKILLWFGPNGLTAYQITWTYPVTNFASEHKTDLCTVA